MSEPQKYYCRATRDMEVEPCKHKSCAAARELLPEGVDKLKPRCVICTTEVPAKRARGAYRETCSTACHNIWKEWKAYNLALRVCPNCYHPNTPAERKDFHAWRKARGMVLDPVRPPTKRIEALERALLEALEYMREAEGRIINFGSDMHKFDGLIPRLQKVIDTKKEKQITLLRSGQPTA